MPAEKITQGANTTITNPSTRAASSEIFVPIVFPANIAPIANRSKGKKKP